MTYFARYSLPQQSTWVVMSPPPKWTAQVATKRQENHEEAAAANQYFYCSTSSYIKQPQQANKKRATEGSKSQMVGVKKASSKEPQKHKKGTTHLRHYTAYCLHKYNQTANQAKETNQRKTSKQTHSNRSTKDEPAGELHPTAISPRMYEYSIVNIAC